MRLASDGRDSILRARAVPVARVYPFERFGPITLPRFARTEYFISGLAISRRAIRKIMSRIFEALKQAQQARASEAQQTPAADRVEARDRRRSRRSVLDVSVYVYGHGPEKEPFHEEAHTLNVNANGALLLLSVPVRKGQQLLLTNLLTDREQDCQVVFLGTKRSRTIEAGVAFSHANPDFWKTHTTPEHDSAA